MKAKRTKKVKPVTDPASWVGKRADEMLAASRARHEAVRALKQAELRERIAERNLASAALAVLRAGERECYPGWLVNWWNNAATSPREARGLPCVLTAAEIPADAEPLPEPEGGAQ